MKKLLPCYFMILCMCGNPYKPVQAGKDQADENSSPAILCPDENTFYNADIIPTDLFSPARRNNICNGWYLPEDMITPNGNYIRYRFSNDICCRGNLYLEWGNQTFNRVENFGELRTFHPKMTPRFSAENEDYLIMEAAASGGYPVAGWYIYLLPLQGDEPSKAYDIFEPDAYDAQSMTIVRNAENPTDTCPIEAFNLRTKRVKKICFPSNCNFGEQGSDVIDSISVTPSWITVRAIKPINTGYPLLSVGAIRNDLWQ